MKKWEYEYLVDQKAKIVIRVSKTKDPEYKQGIKFAVTYIHYVKNQWKDIVRIDNFPHDGKKGKTHIHRYKEKKVEFREVTLEQAEKVIKRIAKNILEEDI